MKAMRMNKQGCISMPTKQSEILRLVRTRVIDFHFSYNPNFKELLIGISIEPYIACTESKKVERKCKLLMTFNIQGKKSEKGRKNYLEIRTTIEALFVSNSKELERGTFEEQCKRIGISTIIPIARALIMSFTAQAGIRPLVIPLIDVQELLKDFKKAK